MKDLFSDIDSCSIDINGIWTAQLYREYEEINWYYSAKLSVPIIKIEDLGSKWGQWDPLFRVISLNRRLIEVHSWDVVLEVLKHEMAHQYVNEVLRITDEVDHGFSFTKSCHKLGVAGWASKATGDLPESIPPLRERILSQDDERLLNKVEKLLALAQSSNEHEALLAMQKVREMYARHNIQRLQASREGALDSLIISRRKKKLEAHESMIFTVLNEHFFVKVVHTSLYDQKRFEKYKAVELLGSRENLLMAEYVFYFLLKQCDSLWMNHKRSTGCVSQVKRSYLLGVLQGFSDKLKYDNPRDKVASEAGLSKTESKALLKIEQDELDTYIEKRFPRIRSKSRSSTRVIGGVFEQGKADGRKIVIHKGLTKKGGFLGLLT
ncbi:MAG: DUF2786 domain-containing protein [Proteobacteria bacterium]|nr:DUF2786 domain-containing protein [Pseudomonadota bacterium]